LNWGEILSDDDDNGDRQSDNDVESSKNGAITLSRMNVSGYVAHYVTILLNACCLVVRLAFGLDLVSGWLLVMHTY